jgi:hypothetical protein
LKEIPECPIEHFGNRLCAKYLLRRQHNDAANIITSVEPIIPLGLVSQEERIISSEPDAQEEHIIQSDTQEELIIPSEQDVQEELIIPSGPVSQMLFITPEMAVHTSVINSRQSQLSSAPIIQLKISSNMTRSIPSAELSIMITNSMGIEAITTSTNDGAAVTPANNPQ